VETLEKTIFCGARETKTRQPLNYPKGEARTAYAAAGKTERRAATEMQQSLERSVGLMALDGGVFDDLVSIIDDLLTAPSRRATLAA
jgi:hypothetical protein